MLGRIQKDDKGSRDPSTPALGWTRRGVNDNAAAVSPMKATRDEKPSRPCHLSGPPIYIPWK